MGASSEMRLEEVPGVGRAEAWRLAEAENRAFLDLVAALSRDDGERLTACEPWTVRDIVAHVLGWAEALASPAEFVRQGRAAWARRGEFEGNLIHAQNACQVEQHADVALGDLVRRLESALPRLVRSRRLFAVVGAPLPMSNPLFGRTTVGFVMRMIFTRDIVMHRSDIALAAGGPFAVHPSSRRVFDDCLRHWARLARPDIHLELEGDLGGRYVAGSGGTRVRGDGLAFFRLLAGRGRADVLEIEGDAATVRAWIARGCPF